MTNAINKIFVRANAEGWNALSLKKALDAQIKLDLEAAIEVWEKSHACHDPVTDQEVIETLVSEYYGGGYMYSGSEVTPSKFQARCDTYAPYTEGDEKGARNWVSEAPVGEKVHCRYNAGNGRTEEEFLKTTQGWVRTFFMDESDSPSEESGPWLTVGIRERVAKKIGAPLSSTFHMAFDDAVENLYN